MCFIQSGVILRCLQYGHGGKVLECAFLNIGYLVVGCIESVQYGILKHGSLQPAKLIVAEGSKDEETMCSNKSRFLWN